MPMMRVSGLEVSQLMMLMMHATGLLRQEVPADAHDARLGAGSVTAADGHDARQWSYSGRRPFLLMLMMHALGLEASQLMMLMMRACGLTAPEGGSC